MEEMVDKQEKTKGQRLERQNIMSDIQAVSISLTSDDFKGILNDEDNTSPLDQGSVRVALARMQVWLIDTRDQHWPSWCIIRRLKDTFRLHSGLARERDDISMITVSHVQKFWEMEKVDPGKYLVYNLVGLSTAELKHDLNQTFALIKKYEHRNAKISQQTDTVAEYI